MNIRFRTAHSILTSLAQEFPDQTFLQRYLAASFAAQGDTAQAVHILDDLGERLLSASRNAEAIAVIQDIVALDPPQVEE